MKIAAVIAAAGSSSRMGAGLKKEYRKLPGVIDKDGNCVTVLGETAAVFAANSRISLIAIVHPLGAENGEYAARSAISKELLAPDAACRIFFVPGGSSRRISVYHGLSFLNLYKPDYVLIHDAARPWIQPALLDRVIGGMLENDAAIPVLPLTDTPKIVENGFVARHLSRNSAAAAQTPQGFLFDKILAAHQKAAEHILEQETEYTDDAEIYGKFAGKVAVVEGEITNRKITFGDDLENR